MLFVKYFLLTGGAYFILALIIYSVLHLLAPSVFLVERIIAWSFGGALGTGLACGAIAQAFQLD